ncbi:uncharacterized protein LOC125206149 [Salvia hispanica]|uniref:uncharacterized protein LOC125206149 n=1 Tax=Salvia hispanica TaxID=49212 RepID=UPI0020093ECE|nr:uncharacterized protein LOC125206149 [Salvia hispanica]
MVTSFRRSLSFPNPPSQNPPKPKKSLHIRSTSLPCARSHPIISNLQHHISDLHHFWPAHTHAPTSVWLCDGLRRLKSLHDSLDDLLHLPQTRDSLRGSTELYSNLLEDFLRFVDVHGTFQTLLLRLKADHSAAQIAVRRKDTAALAIYSRNLSKVAKEIGTLQQKKLAKLSFTLASVRKSAPYGEEAELMAVINDVVEVTVTVSNAVFGAISNSGAFRKLPSCMGLNFGKKIKHAKVEGGICEFQELDLGNLRRKGEEEVKIASKKMHEMEDRILEIEECGERAFRSFINTRVSLLNVLTQ